MLLLTQIELRLIAHIADEKSMIKAFNEHLDIHTDTASKVFNISSDKISANLTTGKMNAF